MDGTLPGVGHNSQVETDLVSLDPEIIRDQLGIDHAPLVKRTQALLEAVERWKTSHPKGITSEDDDAKTTDFIKQLRKHEQGAEAQRVIVKEPYDAAAKVVQAFFQAGMIAKVEAARKVITKALTQWKDAEALRKRREAEAVAKARAAEAQKLAAQAVSTNDLNLMDTAVAASTQADAAAKLATGSAADLSRSRGDYGGVSSLATTWKFEVEDLMTLVKAVAEGNAPLEYLIVDTVKVGAAVRGKTGVRSIPGLRIYEERNARVV